MGGAHHCSGPSVSEMTYTVSSGTLNPSISYHTILVTITYIKLLCCSLSSSAIVILGSNSTCCIFYSNVIVYPKVFDPLTAYCIIVQVFCVPCAFVTWSIKSTYLLTWYYFYRSYHQTRKRYDARDHVWLLWINDRQSWVPDRPVSQNNK